MKHLIADGAIIGLSAALLWYYSNIWRYGQYLVGEPDSIVMGLEMTILMLILVFWYWDLNHRFFTNSNHDINSRMINKILFILFLASCLFAESIKLTDGTTIDGEIIYKDINMWDLIYRKV